MKSWRNVRFHGLETFLSFFFFFSGDHQQSRRNQWLAELKTVFSVYFYRSLQDSPKFVNHQEDEGKSRGPL